MVEPIRMRPPGRVWSVGALVAAVAGIVEQSFSACAVSGEISGLSRAASGHCYFTLNEADCRPALLRCAMFRRPLQRLDFPPPACRNVHFRVLATNYAVRCDWQRRLEP